MDITVSSVLTTCILTSVLIMIVFLLLKNEFVLKMIGPQCLIVVSIVMMIRMFFPIEFTYTYSWYIEDVLTSFRRFFVREIVDSPIRIEVWHVLLVLWSIGIIYTGIKRIFTYINLARFVKLLPEADWNELADKYDFDLSRYEDITKMKVVYFNQFDSPYLIGVKNLTLVLPDREYEKEQFCYIILHEYMHMKNKDIWCKILIDILCIGFWWNPVFVFLKKELFQLIEMRNDMQIIKLLTQQEKIEYMTCLKDVAVELTEKDISFAVAFSNSDLKELDRRMELMAHYKKFKRIPQFIVCISTFILLFLTSAIVIEPFSYDAEEGIPMTKDNTFLVKNGDLYDVYCDGEYFFQTDDLRPFREVTIYNNLEEANFNEREKVD